MKIGKAEVKIAPNLYCIFLLETLLVLDWKFALVFIAINVIAGFAAWFLEFKLHVTEKHRFVPWFSYDRARNEYFPAVASEGVESKRKKVVLKLDNCPFPDPDGAIAEASVMAKWFNRP